MPLAPDNWEQLRLWCGIHARIFEKNAWYQIYFLRNAENIWMKIPDSTIQRSFVWGRILKTFSGSRNMLDAMDIVTLRCMFKASCISYAIAFRSLWRFFPSFGPSCRYIFSLQQHHRFVFNIVIWHLTGEPYLDCEILQVFFEYRRHIIYKNHHKITKLATVIYLWMFPTVCVPTNVFMKRLRNLSDWCEWSFAELFWAVQPSWSRLPRIR